MLSLVENAGNYVNSSVGYLNNTPHGWGCFSRYSQTGCIKHAVLSSFAFLTLLGICLKIFLYHYRRHNQCHHFIIFYCALAECLLLFIHWMFIKETAIDFVAIFLKVTQEITVTHFYCSLAAHQIRRQTLFARVMVPTLVALFVYFVVTMVYAAATLQPDEKECTESVWLQFSTGDLALTLFFLLAGVQITRKVNSIRMPAGSRKNQKIRLWGLILILLSSAIITFIFDILSLIVGQEDCRSLSSQMPRSSRTFMYIFLRTIRYLLPVWVMLLAFEVPSRIFVSYTPAEVDAAATVYPYGIQASHPVDIPEGQPLLTPSRISSPSLIDRVLSFFSVKT